MSLIGVIGLGVMGKSIVLNIAEKGYKVHVFNRTLAKAEELEEENKNIKGFDKLENFVESLASPKKILLMVTAGQPIDEYLERLKPLLNNNDIVIDGGNSYYLDTIRRFKESHFNFVGCGISGGEYGARNGPAMFFGCKKEIYENFREIFETISAKYENKTCCGWMGEDGAGHFVKAVHNGIEYCVMQVIQELMNILHFYYKSYDHSQIIEIFQELNKTTTKGYLVEICEKILKKKDQNGDLMLDQIVDRAEQKGTGKMCIYSGIDNDVAINGITESVFSRYISSQKDRRVNFASKIGIKAEKPINFTANTKIFKETLHLCLAINFIQGCDLLAANKKKHNWSFKISEVCDVWREGCILRCEFLNELKKMATEQKNEDWLESSETFLKIRKNGLESLKTLCKYSIDAEIPCPVLMGCLSWLSSLKQDKNNGTLIQAMRDYFGRHTVELKNGEKRSVEWDE